MRKDLLIRKIAELTEEQTAANAIEKTRIFYKLKRFKKMLKVKNKMGRAE